MRILDEDDDEDEDEDEIEHFEDAERHVAQSR